VGPKELENHPFLNRFKSIGFTLVKSMGRIYGNTCEFSYHPQWLEDKHFTLIVFQGNPDNVEFRLFIHNNSDSSYHHSPFQLAYNRNETYLNSEFDRIFMVELRNNQINQLLV
jgi:hypothetical protein